jgi:RNA-binding protein 8A
MANADVEAVDFEPEEDDLMDEDGAVDAEPSASPRAPLPKLKSAITGASASLSAPKKTKGRGFREDPNAERNTRLAVSDLDSLNASDGLEPQRCNPSFSLLFIWFVR